MITENCLILGEKLEDLGTVRNVTRISLIPPVVLGIGSSEAPERDFLHHQIPKALKVSRLAAHMERLLYSLRILLWRMALFLERCVLFGVLTVEVAT